MVDRVVYGAVRDGRGGVCSLRRVPRAWSVGRPLRRRTTVSGLSERAEDGRAHVGAPRAAATWRTAPPAESTAETSRNPGPRGAPQACPSVPPRPRSFGQESRESARPLSSAARAHSACARFSHHHDTEPNRCVPVWCEASCSTARWYWPPAHRARRQAAAGPEREEQKRGAESRGCAANGVSYPL